MSEGQQKSDPLSSNGRTSDFGSENGGSNPPGGTTLTADKALVLKALFGAYDEADDLIIGPEGAEVNGIAVEENRRIIMVRGRNSD